MFNNYPDVLTVDEAAKALGISRNSVYKLVKSLTIGSIRVGKKILIPKMCLIDYIQSARFKVTNCNSGLSDAF